MFPLLMYDVRLHRMFIFIPIVLILSALVSRIVIFIPALIAFTRVPVILNLIFTDGERPLFSLLFALCAALFIVIANRLLRGVWKSTVVL